MSSHVGSHGAKAAQSKPSGGATSLALLRFLFDAMSGMGAAKLGWEMVTDPKAKLSDIAFGVPLCSAPAAIAAIWALCLFGIAQHHQLF